MLYLVGDSSKAKSFVLIDAKSQNYFKSDLELTWKSLNARLYPMNVENLTKIWALRKQFEAGLEVLFLPIEPYVTGQAKYLALEKFRKHYLSEIWVGVPSLNCLDSFITLWVSQGGCNHEVLQNFLNLWVDKLDINSFDPYEYENSVAKTPLSSKQSTWKDNPTEMLYFQRTRKLKLLRNSLYNVVSKRIAQQEFKKQKRVLERQKKREARYQKKCERGLKTIVERKLALLEDFTVRKNRDLESAVFTSLKGDLVSVKEFILTELGSAYLNIPFITHEILVSGKVVGGQLTLNLTGLARTKIIEFIYKFDDLYRTTFSRPEFSKYGLDSLKDSTFKQLLTKFDYICEFDRKSDKGLFMRIGINSWFVPLSTWNSSFNRYEIHIHSRLNYSTAYSKNWLRDIVSYWFDEHTDIVDSVKYKERQWLNREVIESEVPQVNTNIVYVCYLPDSRVIKVGRTENWVSRRGVYTRSSGSNPKTNGRMRLCYFWETLKTGDSVIDKYIMFCAEDHLKRLANEKMSLVEGKEYFEGCDINEFVALVKDYFSSIDIQTLLQIRGLSKLKQFAQNERYNTECLIMKLRQLANM